MTILTALEKRETKSLSETIEKWHSSVLWFARPKLFWVFGKII